MPQSKSIGSALSDLSSQLAVAVERAADSIVAIHARRRIPSSGVIWRDGVIVSASHTVKRDGDVPVALPSGEKVTASVAGRDAGTDLVALRITAKATPATRAPAESLRVGALALAVGRPGSTATASFGIVSAIGDGWRTWEGTRLERVARLDLAVYDGFSGGALVDASGALLGLNNSALARGSATALPVSVVDRVIDELLSRGHVRRPFIGVAVQPVILASKKSGSGGHEERVALLITSVAASSPAQRAGLLVGDVLLTAGARTLSQATDLLDALADAGSGRPVNLELVRGGKATSLSVTPDDRRTAE